jgi:hypothetical protein
MNSPFKFIAIIFLFLAFLSCQNQGKKDNGSETQTGVIDSTGVDKGPFCFVYAENKDTTYVSLMIDGTNVTGEMTWQPYEKDGARGTLSGNKTENGELALNYAYTIEGSNQTETKVMKIDGDRLLIKVGELSDPNNDGNLVYKDVTQATYTEVLQKVDCK